MNWANSQNFVEHCSFGTYSLTQVWVSNRHSTCQTLTSACFQTQDFKLFIFLYFTKDQPAQSASHNLWVATPLGVKPPTFHSG